MFSLKHVTRDFFGKQMFRSNVKRSKRSEIVRKIKIDIVEHIKQMKFNKKIKRPTKSTDKSTRSSTE
jgi:hypothetical protein